MNDSIICFTLGLTQTDIQAGMAAFSEMTQGSNVLEVIPVTEDLFAKTVGDVIEEKVKILSENKAAKPSADCNRKTPASGNYRMVLINSEDKEQVIQILRSYKQVLPDPQDVIIAMITETARTWKFIDYLMHLDKEHEYRITHPPQNDPDMKRM
ncbi:MAG: DUF3783 domain-containing protein [Pseudomonadota bacterium]